MAEPDASLEFLGAAVAAAVALGVGWLIFRKKPAESATPKAELPELVPSAAPAAAPVPAAAPAQASTPSAAPTSKPPQDTATFMPEAYAPLYVDFTYQPPPTSKPVPRTGK